MKSFIDFSGTAFPDVNWKWRFDIPSGVSGVELTDEEAGLIRLLRVQYGCYHVSTGKSVCLPPPDYIGVYVLASNGIVHRERGCDCDDSVSSRAPDVACWPPRW